MNLFYFIFYFYKTNEYKCGKENMSYVLSLKNYDNNMGNWER